LNSESDIMCKCDPTLRTPWCGKPGCEMPEQIKEEDIASIDVKNQRAAITWAIIIAEHLLKNADDLQGVFLSIIIDNLKAAHETLGVLEQNAESAHRNIQKLMSKQ